MPLAEMQRSYQVDVRYHGQGLRLTVDVELEDIEKRGLKALSDPFDAEHKRLFTFALPLEHELVALRAVVQGKGISRQAPADCRAAAVIRRPPWWAPRRPTWRARDVNTPVYDRAQLKAGNRIEGPAIVMEMDSTTVDPAQARRHGRRVRQHPHLSRRPQGPARRQGVGQQVQGEGQGRDQDQVEVQAGKPSPRAGSKGCKA